MATLRLDKLICDMGAASRKEAKSLIRFGRVLVNGAAAAPETKVDADKDSVTLDGAPVIYKKYRYFMLNKPIGLVTATEDKKQKTVLDLFPPELRKLELFPVGRLDKDTGGLLLITNDGDFAHRVISPKSEVWKQYYAVVEGIPDENDARAFAGGITLADGTRCLPARLELLGGSACHVFVMEGKYHQVRRMLASRGKPVTELRRVRIGGLPLDDDLPEGDFRELDENELCKVFIGIDNNY